MLLAAGRAARWPVAAVLAAGAVAASAAAPTSLADSAAGGAAAATDRPQKQHHHQQQQQQQPDHQQQQQHQHQQHQSAIASASSSADRQQPAAAGTSSTSSSTSSSSSQADQQQRLEYLEQKYGSAASHVALSAQEVGAMLDAVLEGSPTVTYLLTSLKQAGCGVGRPFFHVTRCADSVGGGFSTDYGVILCHNRLATYKEVELAVAHELVHAYDFCRASNLDLTNCDHHACTEIRAAALSGDCSLSQEFVRGNLSEALVGQYRRCVRRRALLSVALNPYCQGGKAEAAVASMMGRCFKDTDPFPRVPGLQ